MRWYEPGAAIEKRPDNRDEQEPKGELMTTWKPIAGAAGAYTATYDFRGNAITTLVTDLGDGQLAVYSPGTGVEESAFAELEKIGTVAALVSPGAFHHMGLPIWHKRFPKARLIATTSGISHIAKQQKDLPPLEGLDALRSLAGTSLTAIETPGKHGDLLLFYRAGAKVVVFNNELLCNMEKLPPNPLFSLLFRLFKAGPGLAYNSLAAKLLGAKKRDASSMIAAAIREHGLDVYVPCHGLVIDGPDAKTRVLAVLDAAAA